MKQWLKERLICLPTIVFELVVLGFILAVAYSSAKADITKQNCYYKDMEACKVIYELGGLTELSKAVAGTE